MSERDREREREREVFDALMFYCLQLTSPQDKGYKTQSTFNGYFVDNKNESSASAKKVHFLQRF